MKRLKFWIRGFFGFSRGETNAFIILLPLMFILIFSEPIYRFWFVQRDRDYSVERKHLDSLMSTWKWEQDDTITETQPVAKKLFSFDPNQASRSELIELGFGPSLANRLINYRTKGGKFFRKKDLMKIYGMDSSLYRKLFPFINLPENLSRENPQQPLLTKEKPADTKFDLNKADTSALATIYGIGKKLSMRIVAYREKLGGFISSSQLYEVYGLDSAVVKELTSKSFIDQDFVPAQININKATEKELGSHPYVKYKLAKAIIAYRMQHGLFASVNDLKRIAILDENGFLKAKPYVTIN